MSLFYFYLFQPPAVPTKKPLLFPNSGKNTKYYQYYNLEDSRNWSNEEPGDPGEPGGPEEQGTPTPPPHSTEDGSFFEYHSQLLLLSSLKRQLEDLKGGEFSDFKFSQISRKKINKIGLFLIGKKRSIKSKGA